MEAPRTALHRTRPTHARIKKMGSPLRDCPEEARVGTRQPSPAKCMAGRNHFRRERKRPHLTEHQVAHCAGVVDERHDRRKSTWA